MDIKFVSYDGEYPNLCSGTLVLSIDGKEISFNSFGTADYFAFWTSGGCIIADDDYDFETLTGPWEFSSFFEFPDFLKGHEEELINIFNENVKYGCCGGCI